jgi:hypothetical protein
MVANTFVTKTEITVANIHKQNRKCNPLSVHISDRDIVIAIANMYIQHKLHIRHQVCMNMLASMNFINFILLSMFEMHIHYCLH